MILDPHPISVYTLPTIWRFRVEPTVKAMDKTQIINGEKEMPKNVKNVSTRDYYENVRSELHHIPGVGSVGLWKLGHGGESRWVISVILNKDHGNKEELQTARKEIEENYSDIEVKEGQMAFFEERSADSQTIMSPKM